MQIVELHPNTFVVRGYNRRLFTVRHKRTRKRLYCIQQRDEQCTGLKDKNGNLIYENDIVKCDRDFRPDGRVGLIRQVVWKDSAFMLVANGDSYYLDSSHNIEIIGNIHEQPEQKNKQ